MKKRFIVIILAAIIIPLSLIAIPENLTASTHDICIELMMKKAAIHALLEGTSMEDLSLEEQKIVKQIWEEFEDRQCLDHITEGEQVEILMKFGVI